MIYKTLHKTLKSNMNALKHDASEELAVPAPLNTLVMIGTDCHKGPLQVSKLQSK
jgi:hypothetical protein